MVEQEAIIVAIELGSSKISGIAGKMKDGTMQILAYAEDKTTDCVKRGVVYNIEKTTLSIKTIISKLEAALKMQITSTYIGLGGQSVRSVKSVVQKNMLTPTYITQAHIDLITDESHAVPYEDNELIGFFTQEFVVDTNVAADPVGIMGTNIEGKFLNVIANSRIRNNIKTTFENIGIDIADYRLSAFDLANNILTDAEKRSGTALIDFGAGTTTISVLKNNIVRQIITLPLGINNITQDLCDLQIEPSEAEQLMLTYADAVAETADGGENGQEPVYTTSDGRTIPVREIRHIIEARLQEILMNVGNQLHNSDYADKLLGGIVITGGGANIPNIEKACTNTLKVDKVRVAKKLIPQLIKNSDITSLSLESPTTCTIVSLLLSGTENCVGEEYSGPDIFTNDEKNREIAAVKEASAKLQQEENEALEYIEQTKNQLRQTILKLQQTSEAITNDESNKKLIKASEAFIDEAHDIVSEDYSRYKDLLVGKDKYKQSIREADILITKCDEEIDNLQQQIKEVGKKNSLFGKLNKWVEDILKE